MGARGSKPQNVASKYTASDGAQSLPPISPPGKSKARLIPKPDIFSDVDMVARRAPQCSSSLTIKQLTSRLKPTSGTWSDLQKVRAIYRWLAYNITYDTLTLGRIRPASQDAANVLRSGQAVCQGYAQLFLALCQEMGIPCREIHGFDKGVNHDPETVYTADRETTHAWNIVFVQGGWHPVDATWGAGHLDNHRRFQKLFKEHWFLTDPEQFVADHFPLENGNLAESKKYQLLKRPSSLEHFSAAVNPKSVAYDIGLRCLTHKFTVIEVKGHVTIKVKATRQPLELVKVKLMESARKTPIDRWMVSQHTGKRFALHHISRTLRRRVIPDRCLKAQARSLCAGEVLNVLTSLAADGTCTIHVRPPHAGKYLLEIMGRGRGQEKRDTVHELLTYVIRCTKASPSPEAFPNKTDHWGLIQPKATELGLNPVKNLSCPFIARGGEVKITLTHTKRVLLQAKLTPAEARPGQDMATFTYIDQVQEKASILTARLPRRGYYTLSLFAGPPAETTLDNVADFLLYSAAATEAKPFPKAYAAVNTHKVRLIQPQCGQLTANQKYLFKLQTTDLKAIRVDDVVMVQKRGVWEAEVTPDKATKRSIIIKGSVDPNPTRLTFLYEFTVV